MATRSDTLTLLDGVDPVEVSARISGDRVHVSPESLLATLGWTLKPEGLCRGEVCVPVRDREALVQDGAIDLEGFAELVGRPLVVDAAERVAGLGTSALHRADAMESLEAPDFRLPDLDGNMHSLSEHRGKKVLLIAYASW